MILVKIDRCEGLLDPSCVNGGPWTKSIGITWELVRNKISGPPQT